ncbi:MAG: transglutaminase family protein [Pseudomonadota bacterium]
MALSISHRTAYAYDPAADRAGLRLKLFPAQTQAQAVRDWQVTVNGDGLAPILVNPFGDAEAMWFSNGKVTEIEVEAKGTVELTDTSGVLGKLGFARPTVFCRETPLTEHDEALVDLANSIAADTPLGRMHSLNAAVHEAIAYRKGVTESVTTAAQSLALGAGVCQDLAHVFISAARIIGLPARYVAGYYVEEAKDLATHAWAEVYLDGLGWTGFDPTHEISPKDRHIRLCCGLDADDAAPVRGHVMGETEETLEIAVQISDPDQGAQSQSQQ